MSLAAHRHSSSWAPVQLSQIAPGQRFTLLARDNRVYARVQHPSVVSSDPVVNVVCVDCRDGSTDAIGTVTRFGREAHVFPVSAPLHQVYVPS